MFVDRSICGPNEYGGGKSFSFSASTFTSFFTLCRRAEKNKINMEQIEIRFLMWTIYTISPQGTIVYLRFVTLPSPTTTTTATTWKSHQIWKKLLKCFGGWEMLRCWANMSVSVRARGKWKEKDSRREARIQRENVPTGEIVSFQKYMHNQFDLAFESH